MCLQRGDDYDVLGYNSYVVSPFTFVIRLLAFVDMNNIAGDGIA